MTSSSPLKLRVCLPSVFLSVLFFAVFASTGQCTPPDLQVAGRHVAALSRDADESRFLTTVRQDHDFSCGAAALATLLIYHYQVPVSGDEVFDAMFAAGDMQKIRAQGFSMLDMKRYLEARGYDAAGYEVSLEKVAAIGLPAIVLLSYEGYHHFVVVKGVAGSRVLVGDPASGIRVMEREEFERAWNGLIFVLRTNSALGRRNFNRSTEWFIGTNRLVEVTAGGETDTAPQAVHARREEAQTVAR